MYWFWLFLMASQPYLLLLGLFGVFGKEAEEAANDICAGMAVLLVVALIVAAIWFALSSVGLIT
ncbi:MAG: hypothetical protein KC652_18265 [Cyanobacteria bacterium HKST-UBA01]|nr:hypothetical protein [Cyanobacteria bacterium HKST-UBA01]